MLSVTPISAGAAGVNYLLNQTGCREGERPEPDSERDREPADSENADQQHAEPTSGADYLIESRESETSVRWWGSGVPDVGIDPTEAARDADIRTIFGRLEHATTGEPL